jgi:hypothetical protein
MAAVPRPHDRPYPPFAERVRLGAGSRRAVYATLAALFGSGIWWLGVHFATPAAEDLQRLGQEALALKVHGATAFATLLVLGAMGATHVRRGWRVGRNRPSGSAVIAAFVVLVATGYALYYLVSDETRPPVSTLHWTLGLALSPLLVAHIALGRRSRRLPPPTPERRRHRGPPHGERP